MSVIFSVLPHLRHEQGRYMCLRGAFQLLPFACKISIHLHLNPLALALQRIGLSIRKIPQAPKSYGDVIFYLLWWSKNQSADDEKVDFNNTTERKWHFERDEDRFDSKMLWNVGHEPLRKTDRIMISSLLMKSLKVNYGISARTAQR